MADRRLPGAEYGFTFLAEGVPVGVIDLERPAEAQGPTVRRGLVGRILREPLLHFLVVGLILFLAAQAWRDAHDQRRIVVTPARVAELSEKWRLQFGAAPTPAELEGAVREYVREEALFREGQAMGLDRDDEIVRRRVAQKVEFLNQDRAQPKPPSHAVLRAWFAAHADRYAAPVRTSFTHLYFSPDRPGDAQARAAQALAALRAGARSDAVDADPYPDQSRFAGMSAEEARRLFGDTELARSLDAAPLGAWSGPFRSGYGWHLVHVEGREPAGQASYAAVAQQVRADWFAEAQARANAAAMERLIARYRIVREDRP
jgi:hypothetical protein